MKCEFCNGEHDGSFGSGRFCSKKCTSALGGKNSIKRTLKILKDRAEKKKLDKELERLNKEHICEECGNNHDGSFGCGRFCSSHCSHKRKWTTEKRRRQSEIAKKSKRVLDANKKRSLGKRIIKKCVICGNEMSLRISESHYKFCSRECIKKDTDFKFKKKAKGGYREGSGRSKAGWYKGIYCGSSYELAWVIYHLEHKIKFERNKKGFDYQYKGKSKKYYPDYYLFRDKKYIEIKGYKTEQHDEKIKQFKDEIDVLYKKDLKEIFEYVINKYGKNFIELYEGNPHKIRKNKCLECGEPAKNKLCSRYCAGKYLVNKNKK